MRFKPGIMMLAERYKCIQLPNAAEPPLSIINGLTFQDGAI